jgi:hypothetical protein
MAKAFIEGMKGIPANLEKHFENAANKVTKVIGDPNATFSDYRDAMDYVDQEFKNACQETGTTASNAAREEFEEHVLKRLSKEDAERWFEHKARAVKDLAEKARDAAPKVGLAAKAAGLAVSAAVVAIFGVIVGISGNKEGRELASTAFNLKFAASTEEFVGMVNALNIPNLPVSALVIPEAPVAAPYIAPVAMPASVEAVANVPVDVEVDNGTSTYKGATNIGNVYRAVPEARHTIEEHASTIEHDYNKPTDFKGMVNRIFNDESHQQNHHGDINVDAGFASAHFHM